MIQPDKIFHFLAGFFLATLFQFSVPAMVLSVLIAAVGKEVYDKLSYGVFDWKDFVCTMTGGFVGYLIMIVYRNSSGL